MRTSGSGALILLNAGLETRSLSVSLELSSGVLLGLGLFAIGLESAAWILGGIAAGAIVYFGYRQINELIEPNRNAREAGQLIVGLPIGLPLPLNHLNGFTSQSLIFSGLPIFLMAAIGAIGVLYSRLEKADLPTGLLSATPGNIGMMSSMAADYSRDTALVSLAQLMRFTNRQIPRLARLPNPIHPGSLMLLEYWHCCL